VAALNCDAARGCRVPVFDEKAPPYPDGVGMLRNISVEDFHVAKARSNGIALLRLETRMEDVLIKNFRRDLAADRDPGSPTLRLRYVAVRQMTAAMGGEGKRSVGYGETFELNESRIEGLRIN
jgi:hypothetical protein